MIFAIAGHVEDVEGQWVFLKAASGVTYEIEMPLGDARQLEVGTAYTVYIHQVVREDAHLLFGFKDLHGRRVFRQLIKVNGVGPKVALNILSQLTLKELVDSIRMQSLSPLLRVKGLGKRGAEKLLVALKDKLDITFYLSTEDISFDAPISNSQHSALQNDATEALVALGYQKQKAMRVVDEIIKDVQDLTEVIRLALQKLST